MQSCHSDSKSFFQKLQQAEGLDLRDNRGKFHDLAVVLTGVMLAVLSNRDGCLSSIQRHLANHYESLVTALGVEKKRPVSRSQLPLILKKVSVEVFDRLIFEQCGLRLNELERRWLAIDGKELRGSIETGAKRGEAVVQAVAHETGRTAAQAYYQGKKESEVPTVRKLLTEHELLKWKLSFDALHCKPETLRMVVRGKGKYLVGVKGNQKKLLGQLIKAAAEQAMLSKQSELEKGHGRIESREYEFYDILEMKKAQRWTDCQMRTLIKVRRQTEELKSGKKSCEVSYYVTNETGNYEELGRAVRGHWQVETNNHVRDVTLKEDDLRSTEKKVSRVMAEVRTVATTVLSLLGCRNKKAQLENFSDNFGELIISLKALNFL